MAQQNTKNLVLKIFPLLMMEKGYSKITVQDILKKASIGRTTFYAHFTSKEDVLKSSIEELRGSLLASVKNSASATDRFGFTLHFFKHIISHHKLYDDIVGRDDFFIVERYFLRMLTELVSMELLIKEYVPAQYTKLELVIQHVVGAIWAMSIWWIERKKLSVEEVNDYFKKMTLPGLEKTLGSL